MNFEFRGFPLRLARRRFSDTLWIYELSSPQDELLTRVAKLHGKMHGVLIRITFEVIVEDDYISLVLREYVNVLSRPHPAARDIIRWAAIGYQDFTPAYFLGRDLFVYALNDMTDVMSLSVRKTRVNLNYDPDANRLSWLPETFFKYLGFQSNDLFLSASIQRLLDGPYDEFCLECSQTQPLESSICEAHNVRAVFCNESCQRAWYDHGGAVV